LPSLTDPVSIIVEAFPTLAAKQILDIGCGNGVLARSLSARGAHVAGVDPNEEALTVARHTVPSGAFYQTSAEAMPFADNSFDGAIFLNSLHHVPRSGMHQALREAARIVRSAGRIVIIEPLAAGSFYSVLRLVEDETDARASAQETIKRALESRAFEQLRRIDYLRIEAFADLDQFLVRVVAVEPARSAVVDKRRPELEAAFRHCASISEDGRLVLEQHMRAHVLMARA